MTTEVYKGRTIVARTRRDPIAGKLAYATINGQKVEETYYLTGRLGELTERVKRYVDLVDRDLVDGSRWGIHWYDPKTVELCPEGLHPQEIGGACKHPTCLNDNARRDAEDRAAGKAVGYYVTSKTGKATAWLLGPYTTYNAADVNVRRASKYVSDEYAHMGAGFWSYGVTRLVLKPGHDLRPGKLNDELAPQPGPSHPDTAGAAPPRHGQGR
jgi:hypothetical protein